MKDHPSQWIASGLACRRVTANTSDYLDDRVSLGTKIRMGLHLASCPHCRSYFQQIALVCETLEHLSSIMPRSSDRLCLRRQFARVHAQPSCPCGPV